MHRRSFLFGTSTLIISQMLVGCDVSNKVTLNVQVLKGSIPGRILKQFQESLSREEQAQLKFSPVVQLKQLFEGLERFKKYETREKTSGGSNISLPFGNSQSSKTDLVTLGDFWLKDAIEKKLIQPLSLEKLGNWSKISPKWQELVKRNEQGLLDKQGQIWAAPYRWGSTVIIYRRDKLEKLNFELQDWSDLWKQEFKGRISLLNQPREVIGLTLKKLGKSYNTNKLQEVPSLEKELQALHQQVKFYNSVNYIEPLILGDTWLAVGWSNDVVSVLSRYPQLGIVVPSSGTALWADLWVQPNVKIEKFQKKLSNKWINFCWEEKTAKQIALLTKANSIVDIKIAKSDIPKQFQTLLFTNNKVLDKSEFLLPLSESTIQEYNDLFNKIKTG